MEFPYPLARQDAGTVLSVNPATNKKRNFTMVREEEEDELPKAMLHEYRLYRDACFRRYIVPDPPQVWAQGMPPLLFDMEHHRKLYAAYVAAQIKANANYTSLERWLKKIPRYVELHAEFLRQMREPSRRATAMGMQKNDPRNPRIFSTFEQWIDYQYAVECAEFRHPSKRAAVKLID